jgi:hypothetical protein
MNAILALPIAGFTDNIIFAAYQQQYNLLKSKGYKICLNVMDNQSTKVNRKFLDEEQCDLLLVEPHNHRVHAAERTILTFKVHFISALTTTNSKFPLRLWDQLMPQVESTLNMMCSSCINSDIPAYEAVHGPYDWSCFPLAPPGCKAVVYKSPKKHEVRGEAEVLIHGALVHLWTTANTTIFSSQRCAHTKYLASPNCSPGIARCPS